MSLTVKTSMVWVTFEKEAIHKYPAALEDPALSEVSFLGYPHRHILKMRVAIEVFHDDRDIEFILFKRWLLSLYQDNILQLDFLSMEMISDALAEQINAKYPGRKIAIEVSEDGENGSFKEYLPTEE